MPSQKTEFKEFSKIYRVGDYEVNVIDVSFGFIIIDNIQKFSEYTVLLPYFHCISLQYVILIRELL